MGNCLIKKLQQTVEDENLIFLDKIILRLENDTQEELKWFPHTSFVSLNYKIIEGNGYFNNVIEQKKFFGKSCYIFVIDYVLLELSSKYNINEINQIFNNNDKLLKSENWKFNKLSSITGHMTGDFNDLINSKDTLKELIHTDKLYLHDINDIKDFNILEQANLKVTKNIDLSYLPKRMYYFYNSGDINLELTWSGNHIERENIVALYNCRLNNDIDNYLNEMKNYQLSSKPNSVWNGKKIFIYGNRTSASDEAVEYLKSLDIEVWINGVQL